MVIVFGIFSGLCFIEKIPNSVLWGILVLCVIFNSAAMYDLLSTPVWVRIVSSKRDGTIRLTAKMRSFHFYEKERRLDDLIDVVSKANAVAT